MNQTTLNNWQQYRTNIFSLSDYQEISIGNYQGTVRQFYLLLGRSETTGYIVPYLAIGNYQGIVRQFYITSINSMLYSTTA